MPRQKILIIGGGIAGLAAGTYLRMNGYDTEIFEQHTLPGGLCTAWTRKGYTFDFCIHWLMGSGPSKNLHHIWQDLGAVADRTYVEWDEYLTITLPDKKTFTVYTDPGRLYREMERISPEDRKLSRELCDAIKRLSDFDFPINRGEAGPLSSVVSILKMLTFLPCLIKWGKITIPQLINMFKGEDLKRFFRQLYFEGMVQDFPVTGLLVMLAFMHNKSAGYPLGGSLAFAQSIEKRYRDLGGKIRYGFAAQKIVVNNGSAAGIQGMGETIDGDAVISAADGHATLFEMLDGKYITEKFADAYKHLGVFPSLIYVCLGIKKDLRSVPSMQIFPLSSPIILEDGALKLNHLSLRLYHFDPSTAPAGSTAAIVMVPTFNTPWWTGLRARDQAKYHAEKERIAADVAAGIDGFLGGIREYIEVTDVATPATIIRYTKNWKGSFEGFLPSRKMGRGNLGNALPGLKNFYMTGQWIHPGGGLPPCGMGGLELARLLCKEDGKKFHIA